MKEEVERTAREDKKKWLIQIENLKCQTIAGVFTEFLLDNFVSIKKRNVTDLVVRPSIAGIHSPGTKVVLKVILFEKISVCYHLS